MSHDFYGSRGSDAADDEARIRALITGWAAAVHRGDLAGVIADHAQTS